MRRWDGGMDKDGRPARLVFHVLTPFISFRFVCLYDNGHTRMLTPFISFHFHVLIMRQ